METACLRIKFTPLLQNIQKEDSNHCLEIVPEISCIQNLDKIQWKKEENSIEYTIPMTYKIILRKKHVTKDNEGVLDKTYHSCVDLLLPSSDTNLMTLGSGDISRIVSDTFVLSKVTTDIDSCSILLKQTINEHKKCESSKVMTSQVLNEENNSSFFADCSINNEIMKRTNCKSREIATTQTFREVVHNESHVIQVPLGDTADLINKFVDKTTNTEKNIVNSVEIKAMPYEEIGQMLTINTKTETKRNLSFTPICYFNTEDNQKETATRISSNTFMYLRYETQKEFPGTEVGENTINRDDLYFSVYKRYLNNKLCNLSKQYSCVTDHKVQPEVRVAKFVQIMESEIMPLKLMLSDIISKCSSLGFGWKKEQRPFLYKKVPNSEKEISKCLKTKKQTHSNRVVYSIVFDG